MPYSFRTIEAEPAVLNLRVRNDADAYTLTAEFTKHPYNQFKPEVPFYEVPVTSNGRDLQIDLSATDVDAIGDAYYRIRAVKEDREIYIESGRILHEALPPIAGVVGDELILIDAFGREFVAGDVRGPQGEPGPEGPEGPQGGPGPAGTPADETRVTSLETTVNAATDVNSNNTLAKRDSGGSIRFNRVFIAQATPSAANELVRKDYVDALGTSSATADTIVRRDANAKFSTTAVFLGAQDSSTNAATRKDYVDALGTSAGTADTVARRDASGYSSFARVLIADAPSAASHSTRKDYVDNLTRSSNPPTRDMQTTLPREWATGSPALTSGQIFFVHFTAVRDQTVNFIRTRVRATAAAGLTFAQVGVYSVGSNDKDLTRLGSSTNDTTMWTSTFTNYKKSINAVTLVAGQRYAVGILAIGTTMPTLYGPGTTSWEGDFPRLGQTISGQTGLGASYTSATDSGTLILAALET